MPPPRNASSTGGRLSGEDMQHYMESFEEHFLNGHIRYDTEVLKIKRVAAEANGKASSTPAASQWLISMQDKRTNALSDARYDRVVLCTGVSAPRRVVFRRAVEMLMVRVTSM